MAAFVPLLVRQRSTLLLIGLLLLLSTLIAALTYLNPSHFLSVDSRYYLSMAGALVGLDGGQYGHRAAGWEVDFPVGYPLLIGLLARLTGLSLLVASKLVNSLFIGVFLLIWQRRVGAVSTLWMGSVFLLGQFLRIITYTWSECAFLVVLLEWLWVARNLTGPSSAINYRAAVRLLLLTSALFLLRYAGSFYVVAYGLMVLGTYAQLSRAGVRQRIGPDLLIGLGAVFLILGTFYINSRLTPWPLGTERFYETGETIGEKLYRIGLAPVNELLLLRDHVPGEPVALVWLGLLVQIVLLGWLWRIIMSRYATILPPSDQEKCLFRTWLWSSATYLALLFTMRFFSPFPGPEARLLAPVTLPLLMGMALWVSRWPNLTLRRRVAYWWVMLLLCSWLQLLPQADLWGKLVKVMSGTLAFSV